MSQPHGQGGYAYPPQQQVPHQQQYAPQTPPPFTISPAANNAPSGARTSDGEKRNMPVVIGAVLVALLAVGGLIAAIMANGDKDKDKDKAGGSSASPGASASASAKGGFKGPDPSRTIDPAKCKDPVKSYSDANKYSAPDLTYKNLLSVKTCIQASGGKYKIVEKDEAVYGKDTVLEQSPRAGDKIDKEGTEYTLTVSTGNPQ